jgi:hypothetical protein
MVNLSMIKIGLGVVSRVAVVGLVLVRPVAGESEDQALSPIASVTASVVQDRDVDAVSASVASVDGNWASLMALGFR